MWYGIKAHWKIIFVVGIALGKQKQIIKKKKKTGWCQILCSEGAFKIPSYFVQKLSSAVFIDHK